MKKQIVSLFTAALLLSGMTVYAAPDTGEAIDVIVEFTQPTGVDAAEWTEACVSRIDDSLGSAVIGYQYDTLLCGAQITLPESHAAWLQSFDFVEQVYVSGSYEALSAEQSEYAMTAAELIGFSEDITLTGKGVLVAVIDTGCDTSHAAFSGDGITQKLNRSQLSQLTQARRLNASRYGYGASALYVSAKIPFAFDYSSHDTDLTSVSNHGTHVAGIIGAVPTEGSEMQGIAPGCQLIMMKVFDDAASSAADTTIIAAMEDAIKLGADVINLSLGRYAGSANVQQIIGMDALIEKARDAGCIVVCAAGNESVSTAAGEYAESDGITLPSADYTDYGTVSYPSAAEFSFAVGSIDNLVQYGEFFRLANDGDSAFYYSDTNEQSGVLKKSFAEQFDGRTLEYVVVPGLGEEADYEGLRVKGKLVLVQRGTTTFVDKANIAASKGAVGMIVWNNVEDDSINMELTGAKIPAIAISMEDGETLKAAKSRKLTFDDEFYLIQNSETAGQLSDYTSWGCTPSLTLKPDLIAVGGSVLSTISSGYGGMSGTSMAAPQITGVCALLIEQLNASAKLMEPAARIEKIRTILMNTAVPLTQENGVEYSPRAQGAGLVNLPAALNAGLSVTYAFNGKPKAELLDLIGDTMYLDVTLENLTDEPLEAAVSVTLTSDGYTELEVDGEKHWFSTLEATADSLSVITADKSGNLNRAAESFEPLTITLEAGESVTLPILVSLDEDYHASLDEIFTNGHFVEGYVWCETADGTYSLPYMGYVGDWSTAPVLDADIYGEGFSQFGGSSFVTSVEGTYVTAGTNAFSSDPVYHDSLLAFSPNGDTAGDTLYLSGKFLRNAAASELVVRDSEGNVVYSQTGLSGYQTKAGPSALYYFTFYWNGSDGRNLRYILPDGSYTVECTFTLDFSAGLTQTYSWPVVLDTEKPTVSEITYDEASRTLSLTASDNHAIQYIKVYSGTVEDAYKQIITDAVPDEDGLCSVSFDLSDYEGESIYYEVIDQAFNPLVGSLSLTPAA
ncbi:MAG: S8 family serine peptidase [Clostridia bacterium]|nr:S8 family serine peptidase [Clostridia bacterium]